VSVFTSIWLGAVLLAVGSLLAAWQWVRLRGDRWGEPRLRVIALRRAGHGVRFWLMPAALGAVILAGRWAQWSAWWWSAAVAWAAVITWDIAVSAIASER
jgi:hypothetical protein